MSRSDEEFIAPPPGIVPEPQHPPLAPQPPTDPIDEIGPPPGVIDLDSGTHRIGGQRRRPPEPVFFPAGTPVVASPVPAPAIDEETRVVGRRSAPAWRLVSASGDPVLIEHALLVGRDPAPQTQWPDAALCPISDPEKSVSKTHAALELQPDGTLLVHDLHSTNGSVVTFTDGRERDILPGGSIRLDDAASVTLGEFRISLARA